MSFFDQKEDVLKIELTPFGKQLLAKGQFKPEYYAFFDDDIIYDTNFAGIEEEQNASEFRILENSIFSEPQITCVSREKVANQLPEHLISDTKRVLNNTEIKEKALPLGNSDINRTYNPSWDLTFLNGSITTSQTTTTENGNLLRIPQLNLKDVIYKTEVVKNNNSNLSFNNSVSSLELENGTTINVKEDYILLELFEQNVVDTKDNFEIELFLVDGDESADGENLIKLNFFSKPNNIVNGFILDDSEMPKIEEFPDLDPTYVQHFFNILVDKEIDINTIQVKQKTLISTTEVNTYRSTATEPFKEDC